MPKKGDMNLSSAQPEQGYPMRPLATDGTEVLDKKAKKRRKQYEKVRVPCDVEMVDGEPLVPKIYTFMIDRCGGIQESAVRVITLKKKIAQECIVPVELIKIIKIQQDSESSDDNDLPFIHPVTGLPNDHRLTLGERYTCTIEKTFRVSFPDDITPADLDFKGLNACEQFLFCGCHALNENFSGPDVFHASINDKWENLNLAKAIIKYRHCCPPEWFEYADHNNVRPFARACFFREDVGEMMIDSGMLKKEDVNNVNDHGTSPVTGVVQLGFCQLGIKIFRHPDLRVKTVTNSGPLNWQNNIQFCWDLFDKKNKLNMKILHNEAKHYEFIAKEMEEPWRGQDNYFMKSLLEDLGEGQRPNKEPLFNDRQFELHNDWYGLFEEMARFLEGNGEKVEKYIYKQELQNWKASLSEKLVFKNPLQKRKSWFVDAFTRSFSMLGEKGQKQKEKMRRERMNKELGIKNTDMPVKSVKADY